MEHRAPAPIVIAAIVTLIALALLLVLHRLSRRNELSSAALRASEDRAARQFAELESLYNTALVGLAFVDKDLRYRRINAHLARINGFSQDAIIGRRLTEIIPELGRAVEPFYRRVLESGEQIVEQEVSGINSGRSGKHPHMAGQLPSDPRRQWRDHRGQRGRPGHHQQQARRKRFAPVRAALPYRRGMHQRPDSTSATSAPAKFSGSATSMPIWDMRRARCNAVSRAGRG